MERKAVSGIMLTLLLVGILSLAFDIQPVKASGTIYIRASGVVEGTDKIRRDGDIYTFTDNIYGSIVIERDNIVVDGAFYTLQGTGVGMDLSGRSNVTVKNINITELFMGVYLHGSIGNTVQGSNITKNYWGICSSSMSDFNSILGNNIVGNNYVGIDLSWSSDNNTISHNNITSNGIQTHASGILLNRADGNIVESNIVVNNGGSGIDVGVSSKNTINHNTIANNYHGITLGYCRLGGNKISANNVINNKWRGIIVSSYSDDNIIYGNTIANHTQSLSFGIDFHEFSNNNFVYHNNFMNNTKHVYSSDSINIWDDGYPSGGNYWSDYADVDFYSGPNQDQLGSDGIWDHLYEIDSANVDHYPLVEPWSPKPPSPMEALEELIQTVESWSLPKRTENSLTSKLEDALHLLAIGNENGATHKLMELINQAEALRGKKLPEDKADYLISEAQRIIDLIND